jgi:hypothetical protein
MAAGYHTAPLIIKITNPKFQYINHKRLNKTYIIIIVFSSQLFFKPVDQEMDQLDVFLTQQCKTLHYFIIENAVFPYICTF